MISRCLAGLSLLVLAGCTEDARQPVTAPVSAAPASGVPAAATCAAGRVSFGKTKTTDVLTGVSPVMAITDPKGGPLDEPLERIRTVTAGVSAGPEVPAEFVYQKLTEEKRFENSTLVDYRTVYGEDGRGERSTTGTGRIVLWEYVSRLTVPFTYTCGGTEHAGTVTTWHNGHNSGVLECGDRTLPDDAVSREVRKLRC